MEALRFLDLKQWRSCELATVAIPESQILVDRDRCPLLFPVLLSLRDLDELTAERALPGRSYHHVCWMQTHEQRRNFNVAINGCKREGDLVNGNHSQALTI